MEATMSTTPRKLVDPFVRPNPKQRIPLGQYEEARRPARHTSQHPQKRLDRSMARHILHNLKLLLIIIAALSVGELAQAPAFGEAAIAIYAVIALVYRVSSRITFLLSLLTLATVILLYTISSASTIAPTFATYTFMFVVIGVICLGQEVSGGSM